MSKDMSSSKIYLKTTVMGTILKITTQKSDLNITTEHFQGVKLAKSIKIAFSRLTCYFGC